MRKDVHLEPISRKDGRLLWELRTHPEIAHWCTHPPPESFEEHELWLAVALIPRAPWRRYVIVNESLGAVGICGVRIDTQNHVATDFSLHIDPHYQRCGFGAAALWALLDGLFLETDANQALFGDVIATNPALHLFRKLGFSIDGCKRGAVNWTGESRDLVLVSMTRSAWNP